MKEGFTINECKDDRPRRVLEFLIPILYLEKPTRVTVMVANTILGALKDRVVHWGKVIAAVVAKLAEHILRSKHSPICPYLFHFCQHKEILNNPEIVAYDTGATILKYGLTDEVKTRPNPESEEEEEL